MKKVIIYRSMAVTVALISLFSSMEAQNKINSTVKVEREYEGRVSNVSKSRLSTTIADSLFNFSLKFDYPTFYRPYKDLYEFSPMMTSDLVSRGEISYPWFYAKIAMAYPLSPVADIYIAPKIGERSTLLFYIGHDSFWGDLPRITKNSEGILNPDGIYLRERRMENRAGAEYTYRWRDGELKAGIDYENRFNTYRGTDSSYYHNAFKADIIFRSKNINPTSFYYDGKIDYTYYNGDNLFNVDLSVGATFRRKHKIYFRVENSNIVAGGFNSGVWAVTPTYRWESGRWRVLAGVTVSSTYGSDSHHTPRPRTLLYPDVTASFEAVENILWIYAKALGENRIYSRYDLFTLNPWILWDKSDLFASSTPISAQLGVRGAVYDKFSYNLFGRYSVVHNLLSFASSGSSQRAIGTDSDVVTAGLEMRWNSQDFRAVANLEYNYYSNPKTYMMPSFAFDIEAEYNIKKRIFIALSCGYRGGVRALSDGSEVMVPGFADIGAKITYSFSPHFSLFVEGDNLADSTIQYYSGYAEPGINITAGVYLKF